jgi:hypothetical protein
MDRAPRPGRAGPLLLLAALAALAACPEERGDRRQRIPAARVPPAVPVESSAATAPAEPGREGATEGPAPAPRAAPTSGR